MGDDDVIAVGVYVAFVLAVVAVMCFVVVDVVAPVFVVRISACKSAKKRQLHP